MRILVDPGTYDCRNVGDVAMLQVAVERLQRQWPSATIGVLTADPSELARQVRGTVPVDDRARQVWFDGTVPLGPLRRRVPSAVRRTIDESVGAVRSAFPGAYRAGVSGWSRIRGRESGDVDAFLSAIRGADLFVACGQATLTDDGGPQARYLLETARFAERSGARLVFTGQGIGPMVDPVMRRASQRVLGRAGFISVRERLFGPRILTELGIPPDRWMATGDEAVELAYRVRPGEPGHAVGVHVRKARLAPVGADAFRTIARVLRRWAEAHDTDLLPVPISQHERGANDAGTIAELLACEHVESDGGRELDTPAAIIAQVARCRVVVTGAYHAAVFALSQGVPVICLGGSAYYLNKFSGLTDLFPSGCQAIRFDDAEFEHRLTGALEAAWCQAPSVRDDLLRSAAQQVEWGRQAYERVGALVGAG